MKSKKVGRGENLSGVYPVIYLNTSQKSETQNSILYKFKRKWNSIIWKREVFSTENIYNLPQILWLEANLINCSRLLYVTRLRLHECQHRAWCRSDLKKCLHFTKTLRFSRFVTFVHVSEIRGITIFVWTKNIQRRNSHLCIRRKFLGKLKV